MATTLTVGGATCGYCAIGICGIASTPARMITSEQTVARIGLRMKVSTNIGCQVSGFSRGLSLRLNRRSIREFLDIRDNHLLAFLDAAADDVVFADQIADGDGLLARDASALALLGDENEI